MAQPTEPHRRRAAAALASELFAGTGEMRGRCATFDWAATSIGAVETWPQSLRTTVSTVLACGFPTIVLWGADLIQIYNDGYRQVMGAKHPFGLGIPTRVCWPEAWDFNAPIYERVFSGETAYFEDVLIPIVRYGTLEDVYFTISYSPVRNETGSVGGVLVTLLETTARVAAGRLEAERERLLLQLQHERNRIAEIFAHAPNFLAVLRGPHHIFELTNQAYDKLVGHRDIVGKPVADALPEVREQGFIELLENVLRTGEPFVGRELPVMLNRTPESPPEQRFVNFVYQAILEPDGSRSGVVAHGADVTEQVEARREVERLLHESERARADADRANARLRDIFEQAPVAVAVLAGPEHVYTVASPSYSRYVGNRPLIGLPLREAVPEAAGGPIEALLDQVYQIGAPVTMKEQVVTVDRDGDGHPKQYPFDISNQPLRDESGQIYAVTSLSLDVTEQVRARRLADEATHAVAHARQQLERVFSQAPVAIAVLEGAEHRFTLANPGYEDIAGRSGLVGRTIREAFPELAGQGIYELLDGVFTSGHPVVANDLAVNIRRSGEAAPAQARFNFTYHPLHAADGTVYGIAVVAVDVTDQALARETMERMLKESEQSRAALAEANSQLEEQQIEMEVTNLQLQDNAAEMEAQAEELAEQAGALEEQTRIAQAANRAKSEFLATMSHELRTPLNAIGGYASLLLEGVQGSLSGRQAAYVDRIKRSGEHLLTLINDILNFAKVDAGRVDYHIRQVATGSLITGLDDLLGPQVAAKSLHLTCSTCKNTGAVLADVDKARQVLLNLLTNAVKFTDACGTIDVTCECDSERVRIHVRDTGRGIAPDQLHRVFDPFVQVDRHLTPANLQGVGLGLAISRDMARGMGGDLSATSVLGKGSTFTLTLPAASH